jgi:circadian clock protein KaiC
MKQVISGISGLDDIIGGGLVRPSIILIAGVTGTGKTTSTMQSIFNAAREDEICMYITAMSEPIAMINNFMSKFSFYNISLMGKGNVKYLPLNHVHIKEGTLAIMKEIERNIEIIKPDRIVIDPVNVLTTWMDEVEKREFYYDLFIKMKEWNSLVLVTCELSEEEIWKDEISYIVDGIIYLSNERYRDKRVRYMEVLKMRGQEYQSGRHTYNITKDGLVIHPSLHPGERTKLQFKRINTGINGLDKMTCGGLVKGTNILLSGGSGTGKTLIGLQFLLAGTSIGETGVFVSFE